jgi:transcription antitermination protein NusB
MGRRRQSREIAFRMIFQMDMGHLSLNQVIAEYWSSLKGSDDVLTYAKSLVENFGQHYEKIDRLISSRIQHWTLERLASVDRNILRLAMVEFSYFPEVPINVIINEAIELAKKYSTPDSGAFINGVLDPLLKDTRREAP